MLRTFSIQTLGCRVNQYEGEQLAALLRSHGLVPGDAARADLRIINTCSVTVQAAGKSRQAVRRASHGPRSVSLPQLTRFAGAATAPAPAHEQALPPVQPGAARRPRIVVTGCWATSDRTSAERLPGVDAVIGHHDDVAAELARMLDVWKRADDAGWDGQDGTPPAGTGNAANKPLASTEVNVKLCSAGTTRLPLLGQRQSGRQRAYLKVQDGCDAHCTYCIIPRLRPSLWSKSIDDAVEEATRLVAAGHVEIVLTGIFLGAYGQPTALRRRQPNETAGPLGNLIDALCTRVAGLRRLRLSSLEPGDLTGGLVDVLRSHPQVVPHFHLPLQSGSDRLLRRMNRQYTQENFLRMVERVQHAFDRPALTTDIIVGFPGETDDAFQRTMEVVDAAGFIHIHAFSYSPRPGTAAARWTTDRVPGDVSRQRIEHLRQRAAEHSFAFRRQFIGETAELLVELEKHDESDGASPGAPAADALHHGRSERYFPVHFEDRSVCPGDFVRVRIERVTPGRTFGARVTT